MASQNIPSDIVFEILTRTKSLTTLDTCKSVCKEWNQMIYDSSFMHTYCKRTQNLSGFFIQGTKNLVECRSMFAPLDDDQSREEGQNSRADVCMAYIIPHDVRILASCNQGILCCFKGAFVRGLGSDYGYYVCKPATKQWQPLPRPKIRCFNESLSIIVLSSSPLRYKIVRLVFQREYDLDILGRLMKYFHCQIFDSKVWKWKEKEPLLLPDSEHLRNLSLVVSCTKSIYWLSTDNVVQFDYVQECFNKFPLPKLLLKYKDSYRDINLVDYQGRLGLTCLKEKSKIELWLTKNVEKGKWKKKTVIDIENLEKHVTYPQLVGFYNAEIALFKTNGNEVVLYKLHDGSFSKVKLRNGIRDVLQVFQFRSDLEPVELKGVESQSRGRKIEHLESGAGRLRPARYEGPTPLRPPPSRSLLAPILFLLVIGIVIVMWKLI